MITLANVVLAGGIRSLIRSQRVSSQSLGPCLLTGLSSMLEAAGGLLVRTKPLGAIAAARKRRGADDGGSDDDRAQRSRI